MGKKDKIRKTYMVLSLGGMKRDDDLSDCLVMACANLVLVEEMTGIKRDRLTYIFSRLKKSYLYEGDFIILKSNMFYKGRHGGPSKRVGMSGYNRN